MPLSEYGPKPLVFLDLDDVLCLSAPYSGHDAILAINDRHPQPHAVYQHLFVKRARLVLALVHAEMQGRLQYIISSTWREHFDRDQMVSVLTRGGLDFVANALVKGDAWCTPSNSGSGLRADNIADWLAAYHQGEPFAIIDDTFSGPSLEPALIVPGHPFADRVVLCQENQGLMPRHVLPVLRALRRPLVPGTPSAAGAPQ